MKKHKTSDIEEFIALPDSEKERIIRRIEAESPRKRVARSRPPTPREREQWKRFKTKKGRPTICKREKTISLTVERDLLKRADAYAKRHGISRAKLVAKGLQAFLGSAA